MAWEAWKSYPEITAAFLAVALNPTPALPQPPWNSSSWKGSLVLYSQNSTIEKNWRSKDYSFLVWKQNTCLELVKCGCKSESVVLDAAEKKLNGSTELCKRNCLDLTLYYYYLFIYILYVYLFIYILYVYLFFINHLQKLKLTMEYLPLQLMRMQGEQPIKQVCGPQVKFHCSIDLHQSPGWTRDECDKKKVTSFWISRPIASSAVNLV